MTDSADSRDPSNDETLAGMLAEVLNKFLAGSIDDMLPAIVVAYDKATNRAKVKPLIQVKTTNNKIVPRAEIASVPVFQLGGGGYGLFFNNLKAGDIGWIKASDRDISLFLQSYEEEPANTERFHTFEDGLFFPDVMQGYDIADNEHCVLQSLDGLVKIALKEGLIEIVAGTVNIGAKVNLGSGGEKIARDTDPVEVIIPAGTFLVSADAGVPNPSPVTVAGTITDGSANHTAD